MKPQVREWIEKAEEDWDAVKRLKKGKEPLYNLVCFHSQQCAEKYIKAFLEEQGCFVPHTHDLVALAKLSKTGLDQLLSRKDELEMLTAYAVAFRYPGEKASKKQAENSVASATLIRKIIRKELGIKPGKQNP